MSSNKGRTTFAFFPSVTERFKANRIENHYLGQILSGHGNFGEYLKKYEVTESDICLDYDAEITDRVHHMIFECNKWKELREKYSIEESFYNLPM